MKTCGEKTLELISHNRYWYLKKRNLKDGKYNDRTSIDEDA